MELTKPVVSFSPFPILQTARLILRRITVDDLNEVLAMRSDPDTMQYIPRPLAKTKQDALDFFQMINKAIDDNQYIHWAMCFKDDPKLVGMICLIGLQPENFRAEVGYILSPDFRKLGLMSEALEAVIAYAFETLNFHSLSALIDVRNVASERVLLKNGFIREGYFKECRYWKGEFVDDAIYSLISTARSAVQFRQEETSSGS